MTLLQLNLRRLSAKQQNRTPSTRHIYMGKSTVPFRVDVMSKTASIVKLFQLLVCCGCNKIMLLYYLYLQYSFKLY